MTMNFFRALFGYKDNARKQLRRYVDMEYLPQERDAAYERLLKEAGL